MVSLTEVKDLTCAAEVEALRESVYATLEEHVRQTYPNDSGRFAKLLLRLPALRSIGQYSVIDSFAIKFHKFYLHNVVNLLNIGCNRSVGDILDSPLHWLLAR